VVKATSKPVMRRLRITTVDQVISGASNVLITVLSARVLGVGAFGLFGIVFLVYVIGVGTVRALVSDPLLIHPEEAPHRRADVIGTGLLLGGLLGVPMVAVGLLIAIWNAPFGDALVVLGACFPLLALQDVGRYIGLATQRPGQALELDLAWLVLVLAAVSLLFIADLRTLPWFIAAWAGSGAVAGTGVLLRHRDGAVTLGLGWVRETWRYAWRYLGSYLATQGGGLGMESAIGAIAGARALGGVNGAVLLTGPFSNVQAAVMAAGIGEVARAGEDRRAIRAHVSRTTAVAFLAAALNTAVILALPNALGRVVLGAAWTVSKPLLLPAGVQILAASVQTGMRSGLLGRRAIHRAVRIDVAGSALMLAAATAGAALDGARGAMWGGGLSQILLAAAWCASFAAQQRAEAEGAPVIGDPPADTVPAAASGTIAGR
jgi:O-antigen/teichoic acid export membrane protein